MTELEERINYERRMGDRWVSDLRKLNTDWPKPHLETAPYVILVFVQVYGLSRGGDGGAQQRRQQHYYHQISVAVSTGLLIAAIHVSLSAELLRSLYKCCFQNRRIRHVVNNMVLLTAVHDTLKSRRQIPVGERVLLIQMLVAGNNHQVDSKSLNLLYRIRRHFLPIVQFL